MTFDPGVSKNKARCNKGLTSGFAPHLFGKVTIGLTGDFTQGHVNYIVLRPFFFVPSVLLKDLPIFSVFSKVLFQSLLTDLAIFPRNGL